MAARRGAGVAAPTAPPSRPGPPAGHGAQQASVAAARTGVRMLRQPAVPAGLLTVWRARVVWPEWPHCPLSLFPARPGEPGLAGEALTVGRPAVTFAVLGLAGRQGGQDPLPGGRRVAPGGCCAARLSGAAAVQPEPSGARGIQHQGCHPGLAAPRARPGEHEQQERGHCGGGQAAAAGEMCGISGHFFPRGGGQICHAGPECCVQSEL